MPGSLAGAATSEPWALAVRDGRARRQALKLGLRGEGSVEILEGLAEGELVLASVNATARDGKRVRPRARE
jgi:HlyD family secretion protein